MNKILEKTLLFSSLIFISSCGPNACDCYEFWKWNGLAPYHISVNTDACHKKFGKYVDVKRGTQEYGKALTEVLRQKCNGQEVQNTPIEINLPEEIGKPKINEAVFFGKAKVKLEEFNYPLGDIEFKNFGSYTPYANGDVINIGDIVNRNSSGTIDTLEVIYDPSLGSGIQIQIDSAVYFQAFDFNHSYLENIVLNEIVNTTNEENSNSLTYYLLRVDLGHKIKFIGYVQGLNGGYVWTLTGMYFNTRYINISKNLKIEKTEDPCFLCP